MRTKTYKMRSRAAENGKETHIDLPLEFEGKRAFAIWDSIAFGNFHLKARVEIDPSLLQKIGHRGCDYYYRGQLVLPRPENN
jgi:hypothetical protein